MRVLLFEDGGSVEVQRRDARIVLRATPEGIRVAGGPPRAVWTAQGPLQVRDWRLRGDLEVHATADGMAFVGLVALEDYVAGTLGREMSPRWSQEALRAQAVASRTYALHQRGRGPRRPFDLRATTDHQVYGGLDAESRPVRTAAAATRGEILTYRGEPILAAFHSASGGRTASAEEVWGKPVAYLTSREVAGEEDSPDTYWRAVVSATTLRRAADRLGSDVGDIEAVRVRARTASGRVRDVELRGSEGVALVSARALRRELGAQRVRSTLFDLRRNGAGFAFFGSGYGHGVGMSQWGARSMAERGASYREILKTFYPGTRLVVHRGAQGEVKR